MTPIKAKGTVTLDDGSEYKVEVEGFMRVDNTYDHPLKEINVTNYKILIPQGTRVKFSWSGQRKQLKAILQAKYDKSKEVNNGSTR